MGDRDPAQPRAGMSRRESIYLDLVRGLAALVVVLDHAPTLFDLPALPRWGHQAVIVFFVLSGTVISYVAETRETTARLFVASRLARLWSVLLPAMLLTVACDAIGHRFGHNPAAYAQAPFDHPGIRLGAVLAFLSESWVSIQPFSNGVVWSLCAEFWYYALFAAWVFAPPGRPRFLLVGAAAVLAGHKALLLLPVWLMGVGLQRWRPLRRLGVGASAAAGAAGTAAVGYILATRAYDPAIAASGRLFSPWVMTQLAQVRAFWFDWVFGLAVAAHLLGARALVDRLPMERIAGPVRWVAGVSFAAYLFHMPLLHLWAAFLPADQGWLAVALKLAAIALLGPPAERSKRWWRRRIEDAATALPALSRARALRPSRKRPGAAG